MMRLLAQRSAISRAGSRVAGSNALWRMMSTETKPVSDKIGGAIATKYALALYNASMKEKVLDIVKKDIERFQGLRASVANFQDFLDNPVVSREVKGMLFIETFGEKAGFSPVTTEFLRVAADNGRASDLGSIFATFQALYSSDRASAFGVVKIAEPMTDWQRASLERQLVKMFYPDGSVEELNVTYELEPSLLGGMTAEVGDRFVDMSVRREVNQVEELVKTA